MTDDLFNLDKYLVVDVETDALHDYTTIHCIVARDLKGNEYVFEQPTRNPYVRRRFFDLIGDTTPVGNNFLGFDIRALRDLLGGNVPIVDTRVLDTLVVSRLINHARIGGHSLESWGKFFGVEKKGVDITDWSTYTPLMLERCKSDVEIGVMQVEHFRRFLEDPSWHQPITTEHRVQLLLNDMSKTGLPFNTKKALELREELVERLKPVEEAIARDFLPKRVELRSFQPRLTLKGTINSQDFRWTKTRSFDVLEFDDHRATVLLGGYVDQSDLLEVDLSWVKPTQTVTLYEDIPFNPGSPVQMVERLNEAGWQPTEKTKGHLELLKVVQRERKKKSPETLAKLKHYETYGWKVSEENIKTLPSTAPKSAWLLAERLVLSSRLSDVEEWLALVTDYGRIHGTYTGIGAWTHRVSHSKPNTANIPVAKRSPKDNDFEAYVNDINDRMRELFDVPKGYRLLGTDADGIQMRIFAHVVGDPKLIEALINGSKDNGTDIHSVHQKALGSVCKSRDAAKTFIYAFLLGAGVAKVANILECTFTQAKEAVDSFLEFYPGLKALKSKQIPADASRGFFIGLDGRKVVCSSEHLMLSGYLQNGEKVIMAMCGVIWEAELRERGIPFEVLNWVHDEWQVMCPDDDEIAAQITDAQLRSFITVTEMLKLRCPMAGTTTTNPDTGFIGGYNWKETH